MWWFESDFQQPIVDGRKNWKFDHNSAEIMRKIREVQCTFHWYTPPQSIYHGSSWEWWIFKRYPPWNSHILFARHGWRWFFFSHSVGYVSSVEVFFALPPFHARLLPCWTVLKFFSYLRSTKMFHEPKGNTCCEKNKFCKTLLGGRLVFFWVYLYKDFQISLIQSKKMLFFQIHSDSTILGGTPFMTNTASQWPPPISRRPGQAWDVPTLHFRCVGFEGHHGIYVFFPQNLIALAIWAMKKPWLFGVYRGLYYPIWGF